MKKIINGRLYDTETATLIGGWSNGFGAGDFRSCSEELYQKKNGEFFLYGSGGARSVYSESCGDSWTGGNTIIPFNEDEAKTWTEKKLSAEKYIAIFGAEE